MLSLLARLLTRSTNISINGRRFRPAVAAVFCLTFASSGALAQYRFDHWTRTTGCRKTPWSTFCRRATDTSG